VSLPVSRVIRLRIPSGILADTSLSSSASYYADASVPVVIGRYAGQYLLSVDLIESSNLNPLVKLPQYIVVIAMGDHYI